MPKIKLSNLERRLLEQLEKELGLRSGSACEDEGVICAFRDALLAAELTRKEREALSAHSNGGTTHNLLGNLVSVRLEEAIQSSITVLQRSGRTVSKVPTIRVSLWSAATAGTQVDLESSGDSHTIFVMDSAATLPLPTPGNSDHAWGEAYENLKSPVEVDPDELRELRKNLSRLAVEATGDSALLWGDGETSDGGLALGELLGGKYRILREIGKGGFGAVYEARDEILGSRVAVKYLNFRAAPTPKEHEALKEEARRVTKLNHPNIVDWKVFDEREDGSYYFVMELLEGVDLENLLEHEGQLSADRTARLLLQVIDALRTAHHLSKSESILHLDLKPKNVFIVQDKSTQEERVKVIDFGIGQYTGGSEEDALPAEELPRRDEAVTEIDLEPMLIPGGRVSIGTLRPQGPPGVEICTACTPEYASPEQCVHIRPKGAIPLALDGRSDLYSVGVVGYEMLSGRLPYDEPENYLDWFIIHQETPPKKIKRGRGRVARELAHFLEKCLAKDRDERWEDANEAYEALYRIVYPPVWKQVLKVTVPLALILLVGFYFFWPEPTSLRFDLYETTSAGAEKILESGHPLFLGPSLSQKTLRLAGLPDSTKVESLFLASEPKPGSPPLAGWKIEALSAAAEEPRAIVTAPRFEERFQASVYLGVLGTDGTEVFSNAFQLVYLDANSWDLDTIRVSRQQNRAVEPTNQSLEIAIRGQRSDIDHVSVEVAGLEKTAVPSSSEGEFRISLSDFDLPEGSTTFRVSAKDQAQGVKTREVELNIVRGPLAILEADLNATRAKGQNLYYVYETSRPKLTVKLSRSADLSWKVLSQEQVLREGRLKGQQQYEIDLADLATLQSGGAYVGSIEISADENPLVLHADLSRGRATHQVNFETSRDAPGVSMSLATSGEQADLSGNRPFFTNRRQPTLRVVRRNDIPVEVEIELTDGSTGTTRTFEARRLTGPKASEERIDYPLPLDRDGLHTLRLVLYRYDEETESRSASPVIEINQVVILDTTAPTLRFEENRLPLLIDKDFDSGTTIRLRLEDRPSAPQTPPNPVTLSWTLNPPEGSPAWPDSPWEDLSEIEVGTELSIPLSKPRTTEGGESSDGIYRLSVRGVDAAGNQAISATLPWTVALTGPSLEIVRPDLNVEWVQEEGVWPVRIRALDRNQTKALSATVTSMAHSDRNRSLILKKTLEEDASGVSLWEGEVVFSHEWSAEEVLVRVTGVDRHGVAGAPTARRVLLPKIVRYTPPRVEVVFPDENTTASPMAYVQGNRNLHYTFGGRLDQVENALFRKTTLGAYNRRTISKSWNIEYETGAIEDFYMDEIEVTCAQYVEFLDASDGYSNPNHWFNLDSHSPERKRELLKALRPTPNLPVTRISWDEANAYALWCGKRLPSYVEWEYAFRDGVQYFPYPSFHTHQSEDSPSPRGELGINAGPGSTGQTWPVGSGRDLSVHGIRDLAGNVSEWTSTPSVFNVDGNLNGLSPVSHARSFRKELLDPSLFDPYRSCPRYWIAGGSFQSDRFDFSQAKQGRRERKSADVGFRCVISADRVLNNLDQAEAAPRRFRTIKR